LLKISILIVKGIRFSRNHLGEEANALTLQGGNSTGIRERYRENTPLAENFRSTVLQALRIYNPMKVQFRQLRHRVNS